MYAIDSCDPQFYRDRRDLVGQHPHLILDPGGWVGALRLFDHARRENGIIRIYGRPPAAPAATEALRSAVAGEGSPPEPRDLLAPLTQQAGALGAYFDEPREERRRLGALPSWGRGEDGSARWGDAYHLGRWTAEALRLWCSGPEPGRLAHEVRRHRCYERAVGAMAAGWWDPPRMAAFGGIASALAAWALSGAFDEAAIQAAADSLEESGHDGGEIRSLAREIAIKVLSGDI